MLRKGGLWLNEREAARAAGEVNRMRPDKKTCGRLVREIGAFAEAPLALFDTEGGLLEYSDSADLPGMLRLQRLAASGEGEAALGAAGALVAPLFDEEENEVCRALLVGADASLLPGIRAIARLCLANQALSYQRYTDASDRISFVYQILSSGEQEKEPINQRGVKMKISPYLPRCAFVFMLSEAGEDSEQATHEELRRWLLQIIREAPESGEEDLGDFLTNREYVLFKSFPAADFLSQRAMAERFLAGIAKEAEAQPRCRVRIGVGTVYHELSDMQKSYREAQYVLRNLSMLDGGEGYGFAEDYAFDYLCSLLPEEYQKKRLQPYLAGMQAAPFLPETLKALVVRDCNLVQCAKYLGIHRNTMLQRYEKLQEATGLDPVHRAEDKLTARQCAMFLSRKTVLHTGIIIQNNSDLHRGSRHFASLIEKKSGGTMQAEVLNIGISGNNDALLDLLLCGTLDFVVIDIDALIPYIGPEIGVCNLPHVFRDYDDAYRLLTGEVGRELLAGCPKADLIGLAFWTMGWRYFSTAQAPVRTPEELAGLRIRTMNKEIMKQYVSFLKGVPVPLGYDRILPAIIENLIDAQENPYVNFEDMQLYRKHRWILEENSFFSTNAILTSRALQDRLTRGQWETVLRAAEETTFWQWNRARQHNEACRRSLLEKRGVSIYRPTEAEQAAWQAAAEAFRRTFPDQEILDKMARARRG